MAVAAGRLSSYDNEDGSCVLLIFNVDNNSDSIDYTLDIDSRKFMTSSFLGSSLLKI